MSGFTITITDAGRAALINAQNNGTSAFTLSEVAVSTQAITGSLASLTALPNELKRLATMAGDVVADDTLHVTIRDESRDAYALRSFGLYSDGGVLFAVYSQAEPIIEKSGAAMLLLAVDARLVSIDTDTIAFGPVGFTLPPASETVAGITEVATDAEADAGTDNWRYITPRLLKRALAALSGFAAIGHKHDASDITSGTFNLSRIPSMGMDKITGLATALGEKAASVHSHTMAQVTGLVDALAGKAAAVHGHVAGDITSGVFAVARIPDLAISKITNLADTLAAKAAAVHSHAASEITSGVLAVARIPDLAISKITNLSQTLAAKVDNTVQVIAGNGLTGGGALGANRTITLGAGGTISATSTNEVGDTTHNHPLSMSSAAQFRSNGSANPIGPNQVWSAAAIVTLTQAATIAVDLDNGLNFTTTMTGNRTLGAPSNAKPGQSGVIQIIQDSTGGRTLAFASAWKFPRGTVPTLSTTAGARDVLVFTVIASGDIVASLMKDVRR